MTVHLERLKKLNKYDLLGRVPRRKHLLSKKNMTNYEARWWRLKITGPGHLALIESTINSSVCQLTLESNMGPSGQQLQVG